MEPAARSDTDSACITRTASGSIQAKRRLSTEPIMQTQPVEPSALAISSMAVAADRGSAWGPP